MIVRVLACAADLGKPSYSCDPGVTPKTGISRSEVYSACRSLSLIARCVA